MSPPPGPAMEFLGRVAYEMETMRPLLPTYLHLLISAIFPIYTAAHASLSRPPSAARRKGKKRSSDDDEADENESQQIESLTPSDALLFPLLAGGTLASLYFILKWLQDPAWLNWALGIYFSQLGLFFAVKFLKDMFSVARSLCFPTTYSLGGSVWRVDEQEQYYRSEDGRTTTSPFPGYLRALPFPQAVTRKIWKLRGLLYARARLNLHLHGFITVKRSIDVLDVASLVLSCAIVYYHGFVSKPWFLTNFLGFSFCYGSLQYMTPTTAWTGTLVLGALFLYDIYFVFFTPMMVTVATKLDVPIKLLFPRPDGCVLPVGTPEGSPAMEEYLQCLAKKRTMAMLGLGDIVVPGMMLAFALRFDLYLYYLRQSDAKHKSSGDQPAEQSEEKPFYVNARGSWGERFWTSSKLWAQEIKAKQFPKPYFYATVFGYLAGMCTTVGVMQVAQHAQPALLYLVPGVLLSLWGTALVKGDFKALWQYTELQDDEKKTANDGTKDTDGIQQTKGVENGEEQTVDKDAGKGDGQELELVKAPETEADTRKPGKESQESQCHQLVYFSISLPEQSREREEGSAMQKNTNGSAESKDGEREGDGNPPAKKARRA
ncbi:hypothetical protein A1O1_08308 [Capronia coronata CBS 617.96]|uniref:Minor histocompatibility antigen H13 n=1 Tax=Capronia coronata CBS 617.96 TaxID=1182541 RepID=W9XT38_9EURO|nr:uncharacterized protein A1O1_08308 [Capronia coronata CBS 617.96]EXJ80166.1 hypothetical protein A1O1_08308 [Capronia coronata CBS 617.96]